MNEDIATNGSEVPAAEGELVTLLAWNTVNMPLGT